MSACLTQVRSDSTPQPIWSATRRTVPCVVPISLRSCRTSRTALAFSSGEYRRVVGFPEASVFPMAPSSFPRSGASKEPRAVQFILARLREVQDALTEALIFGTPSVERGVNILWGSYRQERDWWDRLGESKWGPRVAKVWAGLMLTLGAAGGVPR